MIGKGATPSFFSIANYNYTLTLINDVKQLFTSPHFQILKASVPHYAQALSGCSKGE